METPKQQAMTANADVVQMHRDAIKMAKQQTRDIIARQKAEAREQALAVRKAVEEQMLANQQANSAAESDVVESLQSIDLDPDNQEGKDSSSPVARSSEAEETSQEGVQAGPLSGLGTGMSPSLQQTISQLQQDAALERQRMLDDIMATMQQPRKADNQ